MAPAVMNAVEFPPAGDLWSLRTVRAPVFRPREGQVLVRTRAVDLTQDAYPQAHPAGEVILVGGGVSEWSTGDRVVAVSSDLPDEQRPLCADFVVVSASDLHAIPANVSFVSAASVAHSFATAWEALFHHGRLGMGERVVVIGASHPAGPAAVQISRWRKSRVVVVADGHQAPRLRELGADRVVSQSAPELPYHVEAGLGGRPASVVIDVAGIALLSSLGMLDHGGRLVLVKASHQQLLDVDVLINGRIQIMGSKGQCDAADLHHILKLLSDGTFAPVIDSIFPFEQAARAGRQLASVDRLGSVLLVPDGEYGSGEEPTQISEEH